MSNLGWVTFKKATQLKERSPTAVFYRTIE